MLINSNYPEKEVRSAIGKNLKGRDSPTTKKEDNNKLEYTIALP